MIVKAQNWKSTGEDIMYFGLTEYKQETKGAYHIYKQIYNFHSMKEFQRRFN